MHCNFFVSLDAEGSDGVPGLRLDRFLLSEIFKHLGSLGELIAALTSTEVENKFFNFNLSHLVVELILLLLLLCHSCITLSLIHI